MSPKRRAVLLVVAVALVTHALVVGLLPRAVMALVLSRIEARAGSNRAWWAPRADHTFRAIVRPSPDLLYSVCVIDLDRAAGAVDIDATLPQSYASLALYDQETNVIAVLGERDAVNGALRVRVTDRETRVDGRRVVTIPSRRALLLERTLVPDEAEREAVERSRRTLRCAAARR